MRPRKRRHQLLCATASNSIPHTYTRTSHITPIFHTTQTRVISPTTHSTNDIRKHSSHQIITVSSVLLCDRIGFEIISVIPRSSKNRLRMMTIITISHNKKNIEPALWQPTHKTCTARCGANPIMAHALYYSTCKRFHTSNTDGAHRNSVRG